MWKTRYQFWNWNCLSDSLPYLLLGNYFEGAFLHCKRRTVFLWGCKPARREQMWFRESNERGLDPSYTQLHNSHSLVILSLKHWDCLTSSFLWRLRAIKAISQNDRLNVGESFCRDFNWILALRDKGKTFTAMKGSILVRVQYLLAEVCTHQESDGLYLKPQAVPSRF